MTTEILTEKQMTAAAQVIHAGGVVAIRTETVWGLATNLQNQNKIFAAKNRPIDKKVPVQFDSLKSALKHYDITPTEQKFFKRFKKGLTVVLQNDVAVRIPADPVTKKLIKACGVPLAVTSANISAQEPAKTWQEVEKTLGGRIEAIVMSRPCQLGTPSTIIKINNGKLDILRQGVIPAKVLVDFFGKTC